VSKKSALGIVDRGRGEEPMLDQIYATLEAFGQGDDTGGPGSRWSSFR
jgi:hypothetical protein